MTPSPGPGARAIAKGTTWAARYLALGWSVIPVGPDKRPLIRWEPYQGRRPTPEELADWRRRFPRAGIAIVTGSVSGLVVVDSDGPDGEAALAGRELPPTPTVRTGKGWHRYFRHPGRLVPNGVRVLPGVDVRGDGGYVVAPPSRHPSGRRYGWVDGLSPWDVELALLPTWVLERLAATGAHQGRTRTPTGEWTRVLLEGVSEGARNTTVARLAGLLLHHRLDVEVVAALLLAWNAAANRPPLPEREVVAAVASIARAEQRRKGAGGHDPR